jgi:L-ribulokinase
VYGKKISSEWAFPKILETLNKAPDVYADAYRFIDAGDWLCLLLTGEETHSAGISGFKYFWGADRGFPHDDYFKAVYPRLSGVIGTKVCDQVQTVAGKAGYLTEQGAEILGLCKGTPVALSMLDAEAALSAVNITKPGTLMAIVGTSGVQMLHCAENPDVAGVCGYVKDGVIPGLYTYEAGQSGVGDSFDWFIKNAVPESYFAQARECGMGIHKFLREKAKKLRAGESGLLALDWMNGNRSVLQDADLSYMILGITLLTRPEEIYRALIEATAFGMRRIIDAYKACGLPIETVYASGGIAKKDEMLMQIYADVCNYEIRVSTTDQGGAHGSAIYAAVAAGIYPSVVEAAEAMAVKEYITYKPIAENVAVYDEIYAEYSRLYDYFGCGENNVMKHLRRITEKAKQAHS